MPNKFYQVLTKSIPPCFVPRKPEEPEDTEFYSNFPYHTSNPVFTDKISANHQTLEKPRYVKNPTSKNHIEEEDYSYASPVYDPELDGQNTEL